MSEEKPTSEDTSEEKIKAMKKERLAAVAKKLELEAELEMARASVRRIEANLAHLGFEFVIDSW